jgi:hypothetical protein
MTRARSAWAPRCGSPDRRCSCGCPHEGVSKCRLPSRRSVSVTSGSQSGSAGATYSLPRGASCCNPSIACSSMNGVPAAHACGTFAPRYWFRLDAPEPDRLCRQSWLPEATNNDRRKPQRKQKLPRPRLSARKAPYSASRVVQRAPLDWKRPRNRGLSRPARESLRSGGLGGGGGSRSQRVSARRIPCLSGKLTGNFEKRGLCDYLLLPEDDTSSVPYERIPYSKEQGISIRVSGNLTCPNREFCSAAGND